MTDNNRRQADIPAGAAPIAEMPGTAPGLYCPVGDKVIYAVPGVPSEMREMMLGTIIPDLRRRSGQSAIIRSRTLRTWGESESGLAERLAGRIEALDPIGNPTIAFLASGIEGLKVRLTAKADDEAAVDALLAAEEAEVRAILGDIVFGIDEQTMEAVAVDELRRRGLTFAVAESLTGGTMASRLSDADPEMTVFRGAAVGPAQTGADDAERVLAAARRARDDFGTDIGIAAALPAVPDPERPGTVHLALVLPDGEYATTVGLPGDRLRLRNYAVISLLDFLRRRLR
jgi:nicotinamide-nucleotide amidase